MIKNVKFELIAMDKENNDYVDVKPKNKDQIGNVWIESEVMDYDQAQAELREIYENKLIRIELLKWQKLLLDSVSEQSQMGKFIAKEIESRFFDILKPVSPKVGNDKIET